MPQASSRDSAPTARPDRQASKPNDRAARVRDQSLQRKNQKEDVVDFAQERNEIGNDVDRQKNVRDRARHDELVD